MLTLILLVFSFVLFALATFGVSSKFNLVAAGLTLWVLSILLGSVGTHINLH
jgi:hypothetical protein